MINNETVGKQIARLRGDKGLTQTELGERVGVSFQAVSKWERGETLPDVSVLPDLADVLETTIDTLLRGAEQHAVFKGKCKVADMIAGVQSLQQMGELLGKNNLLYRHAIEGINTGMNTDVEAAFSDEFIFEAFVAEAIIHNLKAGYYIDISDVKRNFKHQHFRDIVIDYVKKCNIH